MRRLVLSMAVAVAFSGAGSAICASTAAAGGVNGSTGMLTAAAYNLTPYTWTLVDQQQFDQSGRPVGGLITPPAATIAPGGASLFGMGSNYYVECFGLWQYGYDAYFTYQVDPLGAPTEYLTVAVSQLQTSPSSGCTTIAQNARADVYITAAPPPSGWQPASLTAPGPAPANPQLTYTHNSPTTFDQAFAIAGNWTIDAMSQTGRSFDDALNAICITASNPNCSFTQTGPLAWSIGAPTLAGKAVNCSAPSQWFDVTYTATQQASLTVGGSVAASTETNLFGVIGSEISVELEAEHEWTETNSFSRTAEADLDPGQTGIIWTAPEIATVTGTLVLKSGSATITVTNFSETRSGVTRDAMTPAYDSITQIGPTTAADRAQFCPAAAASRVPGGAARAANAGAVPALLPGRGVERIRLGQRRDARRLGRPLIKSAKANRSATSNDCRVLVPRCRMVAGRGGTWVYDDLNVVFDADRRVSALMYSGRGRSAKGVGVGSSLRSVRAAYPGASCVSYPRQTDCMLKSTSRSKPVETVFHFVKRKGRLKCDRVLMYVVNAQRGATGA